MAIFALVHGHMMMAEKRYPVLKLILALAITGMFLCGWLVIASKDTALIESQAAAAASDTVQAAETTPEIPADSASPAGTILSVSLPEASANEAPENAAPAVVTSQGNSGGLPAAASETVKADPSGTGLPAGIVRDSVDAVSSASAVSREEYEQTDTASDGNVNDLIQ